MSSSSILLGFAALSVFPCLWGCSEDQPYQFQDPPGAPSYSVTIEASQNLTSIETDASGPNGQEARVRCATCHARVDVGEPARSADQLVEFHKGLTFSHGQLACASCHVPGKALSLHLATGEELPMEDAIALCSQCHGPQRRSYNNGSHGGMKGHWDLSRGPRSRNQCVHCHDPHAPQILPVQPVLPPRDRGQLPTPSSQGGAH